MESIINEQIQTASIPECKEECKAECKAEIKQIEIIPSLAEQCLHSQLKQLSPEARLQLLENIAKEEEALEAARQKAQQEQELQSTIKVSKCHYGLQMNAHTHAIINELRILRQQVHDLKLHMSQLTCERQYERPCERPCKQNNAMNACMMMNRNGNENGNGNGNSNCNENDTESLDCVDSYSIGCSIFSFEWLPFWIFIAFVLFAFTAKPRVLGSIGGSRNCAPRERGRTCN